MDPIERIVSVAFGGAASLTSAEKHQMIRDLQAHVAERVASAEQAAQDARAAVMKWNAEAAKYAAMWSEAVAELKQLRGDVSEVD